MVQSSDLLPIVIAKDIRDLNRCIGTLAAIMSAESFDLFQLQHQSDKLKALGIFDEKIVSSFTRAWFDDGGFVEALRWLGLDQEIGGKVLNLRDAKFDPGSPTWGHEVEGEERNSLSSRRTM